jgi:hypothetical protein
MDCWAQDTRQHVSKHLLEPLEKIMHPAMELRIAKDINTAILGAGKSAIKCLEGRSTQ